MPSGIQRLFLYDEDVALEFTLVYDGSDGDAETIDPSGLGTIILNQAGTDERFSILERRDPDRPRLSPFLRDVDASDRLMANRKAGRRRSEANSSPD